MTPSSRRFDAPDPKRLNPLTRVPYSLAGFLANLAADLVPDGGGKLRRSIAARRGAVVRMEAWSRGGRDMLRPLLWLHAPSVGEGLMARPVIDRIRASRPDLQLAYTFFSPSAEAFARSLPVDVCEYLPFDTTGAARALLDALKPAALVFSKLDVWPLLVEESVRRGLPVALISATLSVKSGRRSTVAQMLLHDAYASLAAVGAVHADDAERLAELGVRPDRITITGDTRYDQVWERVNARENAEFVARLRSDRPTLVAGSTWPIDDDHVVPGFKLARESVPTLRLILAAHEPQESQRKTLAAYAEREGISFAGLAEATPDTDFVWVDRMGVLADLYALASVAYVGGGFHDKGLHSVVEPAAHGVPVMFGPAHGESRDALALLEAGGGFDVGNGGELAEDLVAAANDEGARKTAGEKARSVIAAGCGAAARSAALVGNLLTKNS